MTLEVGEKHLNLLPLTAGAQVLRCPAQAPGVVAGVLVEEAHDSANLAARAASPTRAGGAVSWVGAVGADARSVVCALIGQRTAFWAGEPVAFSVEREGVARQLAFGLVLALEHRDVRLDLVLDQP